VGTTMIRWKEDEINKVATRVVAISRAEAKDPLEHYGYGRTIFEAQNVLPSTRHRNIQSLSGEKNQKSLKDAIRTVLKNEQEAAAKLKQAVISAAPYDGKPSPQPTSSKVHHLNPDLVGKSLPNPSTKFTPREVPLEPDELKAVSEQTLEDLLGAAGKMLASTIADAFMVELRQRFQAELPKMAARANSVNKKLPKILVVGPLPKQQPALEAAVAGIVELKFVSSEERANLVAERGKYCVGAVVWTQHVSHSHTEAIQRLFTGTQMRSVNGTNLEVMKGELEDLALHFNN
jgi:hypothetical protein